MRYTQKWADESWQIELDMWTSKNVNLPGTNISVASEIEWQLSINILSSSICQKPETHLPVCIVSQFGLITSEAKRESSFSRHYHRQQPVHHKANGKISRFIWNIPNFAHSLWRNCKIPQHFTCTLFIHTFIHYRQNTIENYFYPNK